MTWRIDVGDCVDLLPTLEADSVHCVVTSPPYWGMRDFGVPGRHWYQMEFAPASGLPPMLIRDHDAVLGMEETTWQYVAHMVFVGRLLRRVLRPDGCWWLNLADCYAGPNNKARGGDAAKFGSRGCADQNATRAKSHELPDKQLVPMAWRVAMALQADGWWLRGDHVWEKPNAQAESVYDRPHRCHEYVFLLSPSRRYFWDDVAVRVPASRLTSDRGVQRSASKASAAYTATGRGRPRAGGGWTAATRAAYTTRALRTVWKIATVPFRGSHLATFPPALANLCIASGTSERGCCPSCGAPWKRIVDRRRVLDGQPVTTSWNDGTFNPRATGYTRFSPRNSKGGTGVGKHRYRCTVETSGWAPTCRCDAGEPVPCTVLDPFAGAGTTGLVATAMGRHFVGIELSPEYARDAQRRIADGGWPPKPRTGRGRPSPVDPSSQPTLFDERHQIQEGM
jgi:DNA modification methylase